MKNPVRVLPVNENLLKVADRIVSQPQNMVVVESGSRATGIITPLTSGLRIAFELGEAVKGKTGRTDIPFPDHDLSRKPSKGLSYE